MLVGPAAERRRGKGAGEHERPLRGIRAAERREGPQRVDEVREPAPRLDVDACVRRLDWGQPLDPVGSEIVGSHETLPLLHELQQGLGERPVVEGARPLGRHHLERRDEARLVKPVARLEEPAARCVDAPALAHGHDGREHGETPGVCRRHGNAGRGEPQRGLHEPLPGQSPAPAPELFQARRDAGDGARGRADEVVDELVLEGHGELREHGRLALWAQAGDRHEEVEDLRVPASRLDPNGIAAARDPGHHGLGHARRKRRRDRGVGGRPALREDLETGLGRRRVACSNAWRYLHLC